MQITETFYPKTRNEWREWLKNYHDKKTEIWLIYFKKKTGKLTLLYQDAIDEALCFGWIDGIEKGIDDQRFAQRFTPRRKVSNWTEGNINRYKLLLEQGLTTKAGQDAFENKVNVTVSRKMAQGKRS